MLGGGNNINLVITRDVVPAAVIVSSINASDYCSVSFTLLITQLLALPQFRKRRTLNCITLKAGAL